MASRLKCAVQHIHGRIRVDENWFLSVPNSFAFVPLIQNLQVSKEKQIFQAFKNSIKPEFDAFSQKLDSRRLEQGSNPGEKIGNFHYTTDLSFPYQITRKNLQSLSEEIVFSLDEIPDLKKLSQSLRASIGVPIIRLSDDESKVCAIIDTNSNDRPSLWVKDIAKKKIIVIRK